VGSRGKDKKDAVVIRGLKLHDQGQILRLVKPDGEQTKYSLQLAHLTEQSTRATVFVFKLFEESQKRVINYVWTQPGAERIGMNLRWFQSGMTLKN
jgi:hypothetical protein